jgi:site-specific recombinase XerD
MPFKNWKRFTRILITTKMIYHMRFNNSIFILYDVITIRNKTIRISNVLSKKEVLKILQYPKNTKHKAILWKIYSARLQISEVLNVRIIDTHSKEGYLFVKDSKGEKDRKTILSDYLVVLLPKRKAFLLVV